MAEGIENLTILSAKLQEKYYLGSVNYLDYKKKPAASKNGWPQRMPDVIHIQFRMHSTTEYCSLVEPLDPKTTFQSR